jgi:hypothetical protein
MSLKWRSVHCIPKSLRHPAMPVAFVPLLLTHSCISPATCRSAAKKFAPPQNLDVDTRNTNDVQQATQVDISASDPNTAANKPLIPFPETKRPVPAGHTGRYFKVSRIP